MTPTPDNPGTLNWVLLLTTSLFWGGAFMGMATALEGYGPVSVAAGRALVGALALLAGAFASGVLPWAGGWAEHRWMAMLGLLNVALPFFFLSWALQHVPTAFAGVTMGTVPLFLLPLAYVFLPDEGIGPRRIAGMAVGFLGLLVLIGPGAFESSGSDLETWGRAACLGTILCYSVGSILTRKAPRMPPLRLAAGMMLWAAVFAVPVALAVEGVPNVTVSRATVALVLVGLIPTGLAFFLRVRIITTAGSLFMSLVAYIVPLWAVFFGITIMGEAVRPGLFIALALILAGIALGQWRQLRALFGG